MQTHLQHLIAAHAVLYGNPKKFLKLYQALSYPFQIEKISTSILTDCKISELEYQSMLAFLEHSFVEKTFVWLDNPLHHLIDFNHPLYPPLLKETSTPPALLFVMGDPTLLTSPQIAVVGSRKPTPYGHQQTHRLVKDLSALNLTITSGLACGIDTYAHDCALKHGGKSIGVIGNGPDVIYPKSNATLFQRMIENGCIISEYPLETSPLAAHFPQRNRLISALSLGTLVIEARLKSGSLITAKLALDQNKEVFAVPGLSHQRESEGCHYLIKNGAKLVDHCADIVVELPTCLNLLDKSTVQSPSALHLQTSLAIQTLSKEAQTLVMQLKAMGAMTYEECLAYGDFTVQTFAKAQMECELLDLISYAQGRYWLKA